MWLFSTEKQKIPKGGEVWSLSLKGGGCENPKIISGVFHGAE
jgi:hypothetical protein